MKALSLVKSSMKSFALMLKNYQRERGKFGTMSQAYTHFGSMGRSEDHPLPRRISNGEKSVSYTHLTLPTKA